MDPCNNMERPSNSGLGNASPITPLHSELVVPLSYHTLSQLVMRATASTVEFVRFCHLLHRLGLIQNVEEALENAPATVQRVQLALQKAEGGGGVEHLFMQMMLGHTNHQGPVLPAPERVWPRFSPNAADAAGSTALVPRFNNLNAHPVNNIHNANIANINVDSPYGDNAPAPGFLPFNFGRYQGDFIELGKAGHGGFGSVFRVRHRLDGKEYCVKKVRLRGRNFDSVFRKLTKLVREVRALARLEHRHCVRYYSAWMEPTRTDKVATRTAIEALSSQSGGSTDPMLSSMSESYGGAAGVGDIERAQRDPVIEEPASSLDSIDVVDQNDSGNDQGNDDDDDDDDDDGNDDCTGSVGRHYICDEETSACSTPESPYAPLDTGSHASFSWASAGSPANDGNSAANSPSPLRWGSQCNSRESSPRKALNPTATLRKAMASHLSTSLGGGEDNYGATSEWNDSSVRHSDREKRAAVGASNALTKAVDEDGVEITLFIQMEQCQTETLENYVRNSRRTVDPVRSARIAKQLLRGLCHVHEAGLCHRDLKPANCFFSKATCKSEEDVKLGDFGLAREFSGDSGDSPESGPSNGANAKAGRHFGAESDHGDVFGLEAGRAGNKAFTRRVGTFAYAAPEQVEGRGCSNKADIFSLGMLLLELYHPFETGMERVQVMTQAREGGVLPSSLSERFPDVALAISRCLARNPCVRPSAEELLELISAVSVSSASSVTPALSTKTTTPTTTTTATTTVATDTLDADVDAAASGSATRSLIRNMQTEIEQLRAELIAARAAAAARQAPSKCSHCSK